MSSPNINQLPPEHLEQIFREIPMQLLLPLRRVSKHWNENILKVGLYVKSLNLRFCTADQAPIEHQSELVYNSMGDNLDRYLEGNMGNQEHNRVHLRMQLDSRAVAFVLSTFPKVESLKIEYNGNLSDSHLALLDALLSGVGTQYPLTAFTFWYIYKQPEAELPLVSPERVENFIPLFHRLSRTISRLSQLAQLHLCVDSDKFNSILEDVHPRIGFLNILHRLQRLSLNFAIPQHLEEVFAHLGPRLTHLSLDCQYNLRSNVAVHKIERLFSRVQPTLTHTVTHLQVNMPSRPEHLNMICSLFAANLLHLTIGFYQGFYVNKSSKQTNSVRSCQVRISWIAILNANIIGHLASMDNLAELTLINCMLNPNEGLSMPAVRKLVLINTGNIFYHYLETLDQYLQQTVRSTIEQNVPGSPTFQSGQLRLVERTRNLAIICCRLLCIRHFPGLTKLTWIKKAGEGYERLLASVMRYYYPHIDTTFWDVPALEGDQPRDHCTRTERFYVTRVPRIRDRGPEQGQRVSVELRRSCSLNDEAFFGIVLTRMPVPERNSEEIVREFKVVARS